LIGNTEVAKRVLRERFMTTPTPTPEHITEVGMGFLASKTLLAGG
jgi:hypothetical protein